MQAKLKQTAFHNMKGFGFLLGLVFLTSVGLLTPVVGLAQTAQEAEMAALNEQAFGKKKPVLSPPKNNTPAVATTVVPPSSATKATKATKAKASVKPLVKKTSSENVTNESNASAPAKKYSSADLASLYSQAFGKPPAHQQVKPATMSQTAGSTSATEEGSSKSETTQQSSNSLASLYAQAFGGPAPTAAVPSNLMVDFRVNKVEVGEIKVFSSAAGMIDQVETKTLLESLEEIVKEHVYKRIAKQLSKQEKTQFSTLTKLGLNTEYNSINLSLDLQMDSSLRKPQILSLLGKKRSSVREENKMTAEKISAFLNMYSTLGFNASSIKQILK